MLFLAKNNKKITVRNCQKIIKGYFSQSQTYKTFVLANFPRKKDARNRHVIINAGRSTPENELTMFRTIFFKRSEFVRNFIKDYFSQK